MSRSSLENSNELIAAFALWGKATVLFPAYNEAELQVNKQINEWH